MTENYFSLTDYAISWKPILDRLSSWEVERGQPELSIEERNILALEIDTSFIQYYTMHKSLERACGLDWEAELVYLFIPVIAVTALSNLRVQDNTKELILIDRRKK